MNYLKIINTNKYLFIIYKILRIVVMIYIIKYINHHFPIMFVPTFTLIGYFFAQRIDKIKESPLSINIIFIVFMLFTGMIMLLRGLNVVAFDFNPFLLISGSVFGIIIYIAKILIQNRK